jgi:3-oxoacyl-[acyl-carrier protein] reductase
MKDQVVLITGASRGIGRAIAEKFVALGATVLGTATSESGAAAISEYLGESGQGFVLNVTDNDSIATLFSDIKKDFGSVDVLVNNAGITRER